ncbi:hypothetical protein [Pedosphaera parvula]|uniref:Uncharacterized protein n=1 Tax=Pedosphaera parvula (strain Ellin514) TaxID=320771 RepID=B9XAF9_PEDPL|nr:hypothetical protein [Pedosphaera parvula]EEF62994.1 hypothetical protein Cflav_PD5629 [Pedosphaera parvula Ellin514]
MLLSHAYLKWNKQKYFEEVQFAGPARASDGDKNQAGSLFKRVSEAFAPTTLDGAGQTAQPGSPINQIILNDGRRSSRKDVVFFGATVEGGNQVAEACGAIWLAQGAFLHLGTESLRDLAKSAYDRSFPYDRLLGHQSLRDTMSFGKKESKLQADEAVFEGLSAWKLGAPSQQGVPPALM